MENDERVNQEGRQSQCEHKGKWTGVGQSVVANSNGLSIITSVVCGECGGIILNVNDMKANQPAEPRNSIMVPKMEIGPKNRK